MKLSRTLVGLVGWTTGGYAAVQALRLVNSIILARLLAPELLGVMLLVNTLRTGIELLSDVGIGQNIVRSRDGDQPAFYNTAWTVQVIRGLILGGLCFLFAGAIARFYGDQVLEPVLTVASLLFVIAGLESTGRYLVQKRVDPRRLAIFEIAVTILSVAAHISFALLTRDIWALVYGAFAHGLIFLVGTYWLVPGIRHRFTWNRAALGHILSFGKWVFLSSIVYFLAVNFDRLYMGRTLGFEVLGIYGIARALADLLNQLAGRFGGHLIFPMVAAVSDSRDELKRRLSTKRPLLLLAAAVAVGGFISISDVLVRLLYDQRYWAAASILPVLGLGVWFSILCTINESVLLGMGRPSYGALGNSAKFATMLIGFPLVIPAAGLVGAVYLIAFSEAVRYLPIWYGERREGLGFARRDALVTLFMIGVVLVSRWMFSALSLTPGADVLFPWPAFLFG